MSKKVYLKSYKYEQSYNASLDFDGSNDYVNIPHSSALGITGDLTIEAWVKPDNYSDFNMVVTKCVGNGGGSDSQYQLRIEQSTGYLRFIHSVSGSLESATSTFQVPLNTWSHISAKKDGTNVVLNLNMLNRELYAEGGTSNSNSDDVKIGTRDDLNNFFDGQIGEVRIWDTIRTDTELRANMNKPLNGDETGLQGYWKLNEGAGTTAEDSSSNANDGTLTNFPSSPWLSDPAPLYQTTYAGFFDNFGVSGYSKSIYSGNGELTVTVPRKFDDFNQNGTVQLGNRVDIYVFDRNDNTGTKVYTGRMEEYTTQVSTDEAVTVRCLGLVNRLSLDTYTDATTLTKSYSSQDPALVVRDIIDQYQLANGTDITYTTSTVPTTSDTVSLELSSTTYLEALNLVTKTAGADYYWLLDNENQVIFKEFPTTPTHYFMFGRDITALEATNSIVDTRNSILAWNRLPSTDGDYISKRYEDMGSIFQYGRRQLRKADGRYKASADGFDQFAESYFDIYSDTITSLRFEVIDNSYGNGYDIETIQPGDTCRILNIKPNESITDNMLITNVKYTFDSVVIDIVDVEKFVSRTLFGLQEELAERAYTNDGPSTFTQDNL